MKVPLPIHPEALAEFAAAADWYEERRFGLGEDFRQAVIQALENGVPLAPPTKGPLSGLPIRRLLLDRFPYTLVLADEGEPYLVAVAHQSRKPGYWLPRLPPRLRRRTAIRRPRPRR